MFIADVKIRNSQDAGSIYVSNRHSLAAIRTSERSIHSLAVIRNIMRHFVLSGILFHSES